MVKGEEIKPKRVGLSLEGMQRLISMRHGSIAATLGPKKWFFFRKFCEWCHWLGNTPTRRKIMISSDVEYSISRYAGIGHQPLPINPLKEFLKKGLFSPNTMYWWQIIFVDISSTTRPIRPTMRPQDNEWIVWWHDYMRILTYSIICLKLLISLVFDESVTDRRTDRPTDGRTDGRTDPVIEMRGRI